MSTNRTKQQTDGKGFVAVLRLRGVLGAGTPRHLGVKARPYFGTFAECMELMHDDYSPEVWELVTMTPINVQREGDKS